VSEGNQRLLETQLGIRLNNAEVIRNPFNVRWNSALTWPDDSKGVKLACVARLDPSAKGQDLLLQVLALDEWRSRPLTATLFGAGAMEKGLRRLTTQLGLEDRVSFGGYVDDIEQVWRMHHALVLPSRYEGLPLALVEAMICARPAIVSAVAGNSELVEDGRTGFVACAPTVPLLAETMERAWQQRSRWMEMGLAARSKAKAEIPEDPALAFSRMLVAVSDSGVGMS
jgi:glycosyltransferase involved in cell wall biosynthesis